MSDNNINVTAPIHAATKQGKLVAAREVFMDGDTQTVEKEIQDINSRHNTLNTKHESLSKTVQGIAATGGASTATNVTYDNTNSGMVAENIQDAVDELAKEKADSSDVTKQLDKVTIKDEEGNVQDTPFRVIENEEFIMAVVDSENRVIFGIYKATGKPYYPLNDMYHISHSEEFLWVILDAENHPLLGIKEDGTCWATKAQWLDDIKAIKEALSNIDETLKTFQPKEDGKGLINTDIADSFFYISNDEYIIAVVDIEDRVLFGIYRESGKPYFPLNEMYHVEQNEEFFAVWLDADDKVVLGIRRDGQIIGEIHAVNALKQVVSTIQEKLDTIDSNLKELLDIFSLQEISEYLAVETDADGKVIGYIAPDGSHYLYKIKSETIPTEFGHIEDPEGRTEITTDAEDKILGYRDSEGTRHEHKISANHINLSDDAAKEVNEAFKSAGIKMENPSDFSKDSYVELPIPRVAAQVKIYASKLPTTKQDDIEAEIEYNDKDGNYFRKPVILNSQGASSMSYIDKKTGERGNIAIDINDDSKIKFGDFPSQDSFHLKKYYIDVFRGQCIVAYWLMEQVYQTRPIGKRYPYEMNSKEYNPYSGEGKTNNDFYTGAKCHPDGFPVVVTWVNTQTKEEKKIGIYAWNLKKSKEVYFANKKNPKNIILDGVIGNNTLFGGKVDWTQFEIRNPKSLIDINGAKYDGDNPKELSDTDANSKKVKDYIIRLSGVKAALEESNTKETFEKYFIVDAFIDYYIISQVIYHMDGFLKNWIWCTWNGMQWAPTLYDVDSIWGMFWNGTFIIKDSDIKGLLGTNEVLGLETLYAEEIKARYKELRDKNVFSVENITNLLEKWLDKIGYENMYNEIELYPETPSYRSSNLNEGWEHVGYSSKENNYDAEKTYNAGEICIYFGCVFKAAKMLTNVPPLSSSYANAPHGYGCYNSIKRVSVWLTNRLAFLDTTYSYTNV